MRPTAEVHDALAALVEYPREDFPAQAARLAGSVAQDCPGARAGLDAFVAWAGARGQGEVEEEFTRTFDNTDERALELGWHAYGENYARGSFLAAMRRALHAHGIAERGELPDHLVHVLPLLGRCAEADAARLVREVARPATERVHAALVARGSPWGGVLGAVIEVLGRHAAPGSDRPLAAPAAAAPARAGAGPGHPEACAGAPAGGAVPFGSGAPYAARGEEDGRV